MLEVIEKDLSAMPIGTVPLVREHLFSAHTPDDIVEFSAATVQSEPVRASLIDPMIRPVRTSRLTTPVLVLGAADDGLVTNAEVRATASAYRTDAEFFAGMGHNMMLEPDWAVVAERIAAWLATRDLS
jgi:alpha-beta hydrolase superfamily lysophospholipase